MPKMKTNRSAAKRFKVTGSGKLKRNKAYKRHILTKKSPKTKRNLRKSESRARRNTHILANPKFVHITEK